MINVCVISQISKWVTVMLDYKLIYQTSLILCCQGESQHHATYDKMTPQTWKLPHFMDDQVMSLINQYPPI